jgi:tetratricopeptide (TPR) repeat protein
MAAELLLGLPKLGKTRKQSVLEQKIVWNLEMSAAVATLNAGEEAQLTQTIEMFEVITQSQPQDYQSLEILKEAYLKLGRPKEAVSTSKKIAQAYFHLGQLSSAILEYETILQREPDDKDALKAMAEIERKANSLTTPLEVEVNGKAVDGVKNKNVVDKTMTSGGIDDGRQMMHKIFVESKVISAGDFEMCWVPPNLTDTPDKIFDPFLQVLAEKGITQIDKALKLVLDKSRLGYLLLEKYDVDMELARTFPRDVCQRWCVLPFDRMSKSVMVATTNPFNKQAAQELQKATPHRLIWYVVPPLDIIKVLRRVFR